MWCEREGVPVNNFEREVKKKKDLHVSVMPVKVFEVIQEVIELIEESI